MRHTSLLHYLKSENSNFHLNIAINEGSKGFDSGSCFSIISDLASFSKIIEASVETDAFSTVRRCVVLIQNDEYAVGGSQCPSDNQTIDGLWKETLCKLDSPLKSFDWYRLHGQFGNDGEPVPFQPLFFCQERKTYFHPICPDCGSLLQLCRDDDLLAEYHLKPYSKSLKRYLFCPACQKSLGRSRFYVPTAETGAPDCVKALKDMILFYGRVDGTVDQGSAFPCMGCPEHEGCYGPENKSQERIIPFSFYPFYMMIFPAPTLCAVGFLKAMSGAPPMEITANLSEDREGGRIRFLDDFFCRNGKAAPYFFDDDERRFLEILFLKLTFLEELCAKTFGEWRGFINIYNQLSLDSIWVDIPEQNSRLPYLYNFKLSLINPINFSDPNAYLDKLPESNTLHFLGTSWFRALILNEHQDDKKVLKAVGAIMEALESHRSESHAPISHEADPVFAPENIAWRPEKTPIDANFIRMWNEVLNLGFTLLRAAYFPTGTFSKEQFIADLENLRELLKHELFSKRPRPGSNDLAEENRAISAILNSLRPVLAESLFTMGYPERTWKTSADGAETSGTTVAPHDMAAVETMMPEDGRDAPMTEQSTEDEDRLEETVLGVGPGRPIQPEQDPGDGTEDHLEQTIIQSDSGAVHRKMPPTSDEASFEATVVQSSQDRPGPEESSDTPSPKNDDIVTETVIMSSKESISVVPSENTDDSNALDQTIMTSRDEERPRSRIDPARSLPKDDDDTKSEKPSPPVPDNGAFAEERTAEDDEPMEETVIIRPEKKPKKK